MSDDIHVKIDELLIYVPSAIINIWMKHCQIKPYQNESFGVLIGNRIENKNIYTLAYITEPMKQDISSRYSFTMKDPQHQSVVDKHYKESAGEDVYLGTWHTHPESKPFPSCVDLRDWDSCIKRNNDRQLFFVIVGIDYAVFYARYENKLQRSFIKYRNE